MKVKKNKNRSYREKQRKAAAINAIKDSTIIFTESASGGVTPNPDAKEFEIVDYNFDDIRPVDYSKGIRKEYLIAPKGAMPATFAKPSTELMDELASVILLDAKEDKNSRFLIIPTESNIKVRCTYIEGQLLKRIYFLRVSASEVKAFATEHGVVMPSEDVVFYARPISRDKATGQMNYLFAPLDNILAAKTSRCTENDLYRNIAHFDNELFDAYAHLG